MRTAQFALHYDILLTSVGLKRISIDFTGFTGTFQDDAVVLR